jgi:uncharacterized membrane protein YidH (DUF202 family)
MHPWTLAGSAQVAGEAVGTFLPVLVGLLLLGVGYRRRRWYRTEVDRSSDGQRLVIAGWVVAGIGVVGLLTVAAASQR